MTNFAHELRARHSLLGYWVVSDSAAVAERVGGLGYDYVCLDMQHGLLDDQAVRRGLTALDAVGCTGLIRVPGNEPGVIGRVLDAGPAASSSRSSTPPKTPRRPSPPVDIRRRAAAATAPSDRACASDPIRGPLTSRSSASS